MKQASGREEYREYEDADLKYSQIEYTIEDLIDFLQRIETNKKTIQVEIVNGERYIVGPLQELVDIMASHCLMDFGFINVLNKTLLELKGFEVFPIKRNNRRWIVGGIRTSKGIIRFE